MKQRLFNLGSLNLYVNPFLQNNGQLLRAVNVDTTPYGALTKRKGYEAYLGTATGGTVQQLFSVDLTDNNSAPYLYRYSNNVLFFKDLTGTADWTACNNGTFSGNNIGYTVLENTMIVGDGVGSTRHTTNGTSFTNTTGAPIARYFEQFQQRVFAGGTANTLFFSTTGTASDWSGVSPSDSSSFQIPGEGQIVGLRKVNDTLKIFKKGGNMFTFDGDYLVDEATKSGLNYSNSLANIEDYHMWINDDGMYGSGGGRPELLSNPIEPFFREANGFNTDAPAGAHRFDFYFSPLETITEDILDTSIEKPVIKYNIQKNQFLTWKMNALASPGITAFASYKDATTNPYNAFIFGDSAGQVYKFFKDSSNNDIYDDNGAPIESIVEMLIHLDAPEDAKQWYELTLFFNPGSTAKVQIGTTNVFNRNNLRLTDLGDTSEGFIHYRFPQKTQSNLLFLRIYENSTNPSWTWYGGVVDADIVERR